MRCELRLWDLAPASFLFPQTTAKEVERRAEIACSSFQQLTFKRILPQNLGKMLGGFIALFNFLHSSRQNTNTNSYFWHSWGFQSASRFFFHLSNDLSVINFSPGTSGIPTALAKAEAPWSVSNMWSVWRKDERSSHSNCCTNQFQSMYIQLQIKRMAFQQCPIFLKTLI